MQNRGGTAIEVIRETVHDIRMVKGRGVLALIGIMIGTAAVIAMLHVGHNARKAALSQFEALGTDLVMMQPQSSDSPTPRIAVRDVLDLPKRDVGLSAVSAMIQTGGNVRAGRTDVQATIVAATDGVYELGKAHLERGRFTSDLDGFAPFAVLGAGLASEIQASSGKAVEIGDRVAFGDQLLTVVGLLLDTPTNYIHVPRKRPTPLPGAHNWR